MHSLRMYISARGAIRSSSRGTAVSDFITMRLAKYMEKEGRLFPRMLRIWCGLSAISYRLLAMDPRPTDTNTFASW